MAAGVPSHSLILAQRGRSLRLQGGGRHWRGYRRGPTRLTTQGARRPRRARQMQPFPPRRKVPPPHLPVARPVRIVNVASAAHMFGKIDFDSFKQPKDYKEWPFYGQRWARGGRGQAPGTCHARRVQSLSAPLPCEPRPRRTPLRRSPPRLLTLLLFAPLPGKQTNRDPHPQQAGQHHVHVRAGAAPGERPLQPHRQRAAPGKGPATPPAPHPICPATPPCVPVAGTRAGCSNQR